MQHAFGWIAYSLVVAATGVLAVGLVQRYSDKRESSVLTKCLAVSAVVVALACLLLIPVDIYTVSAKDVHGDHELRMGYYILYSLILTYLFFLLPFGYFYYEEDGYHDSGTGSSQAMAALKYTLGFLVILAVLLVIGAFVLKRGGTAGEGESIGHKLKSVTQLRGSIILFCICVISGFGSVLCAFYTAYGLASLPFSLFPTSSGYEDTHAEVFDARTSLLGNQNKIEYIEARQYRGELNAKDRASLRSLRREQQDIERQQERASRRDEKSRSVQFAFLVSYPFRIALSLVTLAASALVMSSFAIALIDRIVHSSCGVSCGFAIDKSHYTNPLNVILTKSAAYFPADFIFFTALILYLFICTAFGITKLGIRFLCFRLYRIRKGRTLQNGLLMGIWYLIFMLIAVQVQLIYLVPQYITFGDQASCSLASKQSSHCTPSQFSFFISGLSAHIPFFGSLFFIASIALVFGYTTCLALSTYRFIYAIEPAQEEDDDLF